MITLLFASLLLAASQQLLAREPRPDTLWDLERLSQTPHADWGETKDLVQEVYYAGEPFGGRPTRVFAYVGRPEGEGPFPAMVLVHGGGGQAFDDWARHWAKRGYVAISMDTAGAGPGKAPLPDGGPDQDHESKFRNFTVAESREMWTYHAVADVILAHSLLRALPDVDPERTALTGISWGGYLTCITVDSAAAPILNGAPVASAELLYTIDQGPWQPRERKTLPAEVSDGLLRAKLPAERPIAFFLQATAPEVAG